MYPTSGEIKSHNVDNVYVIYYFIEKYIKSRESIVTYSNNGIWNENGMC